MGLFTWQIGNLYESCLFDFLKSELVSKSRRPIPEIYGSHCTYSSIIFSVTRVFELI